MTVVVPCHMQAQYLSQAVDSVMGQTYRHLELFVVTGDEASHEMAETLKVLFADSPLEGQGFTVIPNCVKGLADARNQAIKLATGRYVACLDADDTWEPTFLERTVNASLDVPDALTITTCDMSRFGARTDPLTLGPYTREAELEANYILVCSLYSKRLWELVGGYQNCLMGYEDWNFWIACGEHRAVVRKVGERLFNYRIHEQQGSNLCERNHEMLKAAIHLINPGTFGPPSVEDMLTVTRCSEEARVKFLQRAEWFLDDPNAQRFKSLLSDELRATFPPEDDK